MHIRFIRNVILVKSRNGTLFIQTRDEFTKKSRTRTHKHLPVSCHSHVIWSHKIFCFIPKVFFFDIRCLILQRRGSWTWFNQTGPTARWSDTTRSSYLVRISVVGKPEKVLHDLSVYMSVRYSHRLRCHSIFYYLWLVQIQQKAYIAQKRSHLFRDIIF